MRQNLFDCTLTDSLINGLLKFSHEKKVGAGAVITASLNVTLLESTGADVLTLADGTEGQVKIFIHETDGGSVIITPTNFAGASSATITMLTAGDCVAMIFLRGSWWLLWSTSNIEGTPLVIA
jgi:hypothetical protein